MFVGLILILLIGLLITLVALGFWLWTLVDCLSNKYLSDNKKVLWTMLIVFLGLLGSLAYFFAERSSQHKSYNYPPPILRQPQVAQPYHPYQEGYRAQPIPRTYQPDRAVPIDERQPAQQVQNEHIQISYPE